MTFYTQMKLSLWAKLAIGGMLTFTLFMFNGCTMVSKEDCMAMDWYALGRADGMGGRAITYYQNRAKPCIEHGIMPDREAYYQGHDDGLAYYCSEQNGYEMGRRGELNKTLCPPDQAVDFRRGYEAGLAVYCTEENGYTLGVQGKRYQYVCPPDLEAPFRAGYEQGKRVYEQKAKIKNFEKKLTQINRDIQQKETQLAAEQIAEKRSLLRRDIQLLDAEYRNLTLEIRMLKDSLARDGHYY